jgi:hypothetical protein
MSWQMVFSTSQTTHIPASTTRGCFVGAPWALQLNEEKQLKILINLPLPGHAETSIFTHGM